MKCRVELLGTQLSLDEGQVVRLEDATNIPPREDRVAQYYAQPYHGHWGADSILVLDTDVTITQ